DARGAALERQEARRQKRVVDVAQPAGQQHHDTAADFRFGQRQRVKIGAADKHHPRFADGGHRGRPRFTVDHRQFAENRARPEDAENPLGAGGRDHRGLQQPAVDTIAAVPGIARQEQHLVGGERGGAAFAEQLGRQVRRQAAKDRVARRVLRHVLAILWRGTPTQGTGREVAQGLGAATWSRSGRRASGITAAPIGPMRKGASVVAAVNQDMRRKLTVILASDVAGYSRLIGEDEEDTVRRFREIAAEFAGFVQQHQGRIFNTAGDAILAEFASAVDATRCAIAIQCSNNARNAAVPGERRIIFRIGLAVGDVVVGDAGDLMGDAVNIAARLEGIADPGGICASEDILTHVHNKIALDATDIGKQSLKNIQRPIRAFKIAPDVENAGARRTEAKSKAQNRFPTLRVASAAALAVAALAAFLVWKLEPFSPHAAPPRAGVPFDAAKVPLVTDRVRSALADFAREPSYKAIAISRIGWGVASGARDTVSAEREALDRCRKRDQKGDCRIYALGNRVVW